MKIVIYDHETYEPITVVEVHISFLREIESGKRPPSLIFPVLHDLLLQSRAELSSYVKMRTVRINFERIMKGNRTLLWLAKTEDGETALLLRSAFLPGQNKEVQAREQAAFLGGLLAAVGS